MMHFGRVEGLRKEGEGGKGGRKREMKGREEEVLRSFETLGGV